MYDVIKVTVVMRLREIKVSHRRSNIQKTCTDLSSSIRATVPLVYNCSRNIMRSFSGGPLWWPILFEPRLGPCKHRTYF
jgi:hypothetical protein